MLHFLNSPVGNIGTFVTISPFPSPVKVENMPMDTTQFIPNRTNYKFFSLASNGINLTPGVYKLTFVVSNAQGTTASILLGDNSGYTVFYDSNNTKSLLYPITQTTPALIMIPFEIKKGTGMQTIIIGGGGTFDLNNIWLEKF